MDLANALVPPPMHSLWLRRKVLHHIPTTAQTVADTLRPQQMTVAWNCLPHSIREVMAMATRPRPSIAHTAVKMSRSYRHGLSPLTSEPTTRLPKRNDLIANHQPCAIPFNPRRSNNLAIPSPDPMARFGGGEIACPFQRADLDAACLLDCPAPTSPGPAHNPNPLAIFNGPTGDGLVFAYDDEAMVRSR